MRDERDLPLRFIECRQCGRLLATVRTSARGKAEFECRRCRYRGEYDYFPIGFRSGEEGETDDGTSEGYECFDTRRT